MDATMSAVADITVKPHEPGVYFGMDADSYRNDPSLGSSDEKTLAANPSSYWYSSWMNPGRPPDVATPATKRGTAVHVRVLYGEAEFNRRYMRGADNDESMTPAEKAAATKAANATAVKLGLIALPGKEYDNIAIAAAMIAKNPELSTALVGGLNEVSVFWVRDGIPKKARIDVLKPRGVGDLKSLANKFDVPFPKACTNSIGNYRYDVQACHYLEARALLAGFAAEGRVSGDHDETLFKAVCASKTWAWQWVWWQAEGAPITFSKILSPQNPILETAASTIERADANFRAYMDHFGPSQMWLLQEKPSELFIEELPSWYARDY